MITPTFLLLTVAVLIRSIKSQEPPVGRTWKEHWFDHKQTLRLQAWDENVALYYDNDMDRNIIWTLNTSSLVWNYTKSVYGDFGGQQRLFVNLHANKYFGGHPSTFFDASHDFRNVIDIGQQGSWAQRTAWNLDSITHEISHIVESASKKVHNSPAFSIWGDSKWAEIFLYDVYTKLNWTVEAKQFFDKATNTIDNYPQKNTHWFRDWFFPIYDQHGGTATLNRYFDLLAANFPKRALNATYFEYTRDLNFGEFVHFWSGAAQANLRDLAISAFGRYDANRKDWVTQFDKARKDFAGIVY